MERYIYAHTHHHRAISDLGEQAKYKDSIKKATCKNAFDLAEQNLVDTFEAGRAYESELLLVSALVSKLPEEIRHKFDDLPLSDLTVPKIADRIELYRNRHLKAKAKAAVVEEEGETSVGAVASKKKWTNKKNGFRKFNPNPSNQKSQGQSGSSGAPKKRPFCLHCKKDGHTQDTCFAREREGASCYSQKGEPYYPKKKTNEVSEKVNSVPYVQSVQSGFPY